MEGNSAILAGIGQACGAQCPSSAAWARESPKGIRPSRL